MERFSRVRKAIRQTWKYRRAQAGALLTMLKAAVLAVTFRLAMTTAAKIVTGPLPRTARNLKRKMKEVRKMSGTTNGDVDTEASSTKRVPGTGGALPDDVLDSLAGGPLLEYVEEAEAETQATIDDPENHGVQGPKKAARKAEELQDIQGTLAACIGPLNRALSAYVPSLRFHDEEVRTISVLGGRVVQRKVDVGEWDPEIPILCVIIGAKLAVAAPDLAEKAREIRNRAPFFGGQVRREGEAPADNRDEAPANRYPPGQKQV